MRVTLNLEDVSAKAATEYSAGLTFKFNCFFFYKKFFLHWLSLTFRCMFFLLWLLLTFQKFSLLFLSLTFVDHFFLGQILSAKISQIDKTKSIIRIQLPNKEKAMLDFSQLSEFHSDKIPSSLTTKSSINVLVLNE